MADKINADELRELLLELAIERAEHGPHDGGYMTQGTEDSVAKILAILAEPHSFDYLLHTLNASDEGEDNLTVALERLQADQEKGTLNGQIDQRPLQ